MPVADIEGIVEIQEEDRKDTGRNDEYPLIAVRFQQFQWSIQPMLQGFQHVYNQGFVSDKN